MRGRGSEEGRREEGEGGRAGGRAREGGKEGSMSSRKGGGIFRGYAFGGTGLVGWVTARRVGWEKGQWVWLEQA